MTRHLFFVLIPLLACGGGSSGAGGGSGGSGGSGGGGSNGGGGGTSGTCTNQPFTPICACDYHVNPSPGLGTCDEADLAAMDNNLPDGGTEEVCNPDGGMKYCGGEMVAICPMSGRVGTCWTTSGGATRYYSPSYTTASAQTDCAHAIANGGCFQPN